MMENNYYINEAFLKQTAIDYDMDYESVKQIADTYTKEEFYLKLEEFISNRSVT